MTYPLERRQGSPGFAEGQEEVPPGREDGEQTEAASAGVGVGGVALFWAQRCVPGWVGCPVQELPGRRGDKRAGRVRRGTRGEWQPTGSRATQRRALLQTEGCDAAAPGLEWPGARPQVRVVPAARHAKRTLLDWPARGPPLHHPDMALANLPGELPLFVDKHVRYIQSLDTVRSLALAAHAARPRCPPSSPVLTRSSAKTSSSTGSPNICA